MTFWRVLGVLSGTSMDGVDVAAADLRLRGDAVDLRPLGDLGHAYPDGLRERLLGPADLRQVCELDTRIGRCFADAAERGLVLAGGADLIGSLGQTVHHWVENGRVRGTLQLGQPAWIAEATGVPVVSGFRARDVAAGGHGAPLAGLFDALWLADRAEPTAAVNLGGIANITVLTPPAQPLAYDTGPGNALLDAAVRAITANRRSQDTEGALAAAGTAHPALLDALLADPYYAAAPPKSTGKEHFGDDYLRTALHRFGDIADADLLATLTELTATTVAEQALRHRVRTVVASGGGTANPTLLAALRDRLSDGGATLRTSDDFGLPAHAKEAYLAALLAFLTVHGLPGNAPHSTGARGRRLLGSITPGRTPLALPEPAGNPVRRLRVLDVDPRSPEETSCVG